MDLDIGFVGGRWKVKGGDWVDKKLKIK